MNKKFDPKITKGPWYMAQITGVFLSDKNELTFKQNAITDDYRKAFMAIPEMLEVIKAARELYPIDLDLLELKDVSSLQILNELLISVECVCNAIKKLDEKHGDEVIYAKSEQ